jgi:excinuclease ABC subunit A
MTELNDHLKLLFSRAATLYCRDCGAPVRRDTRRASTRDRRAPDAPAARRRLV